MILFYKVSGCGPTRKRAKTLCRVSETVTEITTVVSRIDFTHITISAHSSESSPGVDGTRMRYKAHRNRDSCEV